MMFPESLRGVTLHKKISFLKPFGFFDYVNLQMNARCVISDSGTISEESSILQFPAVTIRNAMERPEAMDSGAIILTGLEPDAVLAAVAVVLRERKAGHTVSVPADYLIANTSQRVVKLIVGTSGLIHRWDGINSVIS